MPKNDSQESIPKESSIATVVTDAMRSRNINVERLSQTTGISERFLKLLLEGKLEKLPSAPYIHGYLLKIAQVLGLDGDRLWDEYVSENDTVRRSGERDTLPKNRFALSKIKRMVWVVLTLLIVVLVYIGFRMQFVFNPSPISLENVTDNMVVREEKISIRGTVDVNDRLTINTEQVYPDSEGHFEKEIALQPGFNTIVFMVRKTLRGEKEIVRRIFYEIPKNISEETVSTSTPF